MPLTDDDLSHLAELKDLARELHEVHAQEIAALKQHINSLARAQDILGRLLEKTSRLIRSG